MKHTSVRALGLLLALGAALLPGRAAGQATGVVTGTVTSSLGAPLAGAQVVVQGTQIGSLTNTQGRFELRGVAAGGQVVRATMLGYSTGEVAVTVSEAQPAVANFVLDQEAIDLEGVVVTALGINREERAIGYAVEAIAGDDLNQAREPNLVNALAGKVAGVQVKSTGPLGGSSSIVLRGYSSISGNNQPLFIIDGVPIDNSTPNKNESGESLFGNLDYGNAAQDLNPDDIESISVLKGANAAALYGSRAANGVILITTKKGRSAVGLGIQASTSLTFDTPSRVPTFQNGYGGGATDTGYEWVDGAGGGINDGVDESWGMPLDGRMVRQWNGTEPWLPVPFSVRQFYTTGRSTATNVAVSGAFDRGSVRFSAAQTDATGLVPNQELERTTLSLASVYDVTDALSVDGNVTYARNFGFNRPGAAGNYNIPYMWLWWQVNTDTRDLKAAMEGYDPASGQLAPNWNHNYFDNPYWMTDYRTNEDTRDRVTGQATVNYRFSDLVSVMARAGTDWYQHRTQQAFPMYSQENPFGGFTEGSTFLQETNADFLLSLTPQLEGPFSVSARGGANARFNDREARFLRAERMNLPGIYNVSNAAIPPTIDGGLYRKRVNSVYGLASFGYGNYLFVDVTGRNDWSSTLPEGENSYFYPSVSTSFVFTDAFQLPEGLLEYGKLRASWAKVGNDADPYQLAAVAELYDPMFGGVVGYTTSDRLPNAQLRPEETVSWEVGAELRMGRATLDLTYYNSLTRDQILPVDISPTTGYTNMILNAGEVANRGVEALLSADLVRNEGGLQWTSSLNFGRNRSEVVSLHDELETLQLSSFGGLTVEARRGYPYGALFGNVYLRNENGDVVVNAQGRPQVEPTPRVIGSFEPDWTAGLENTFRYGNVIFSFLVDHRQGGSILCGTCRLGNRTGVLAESVEGRDEGGLVFPGVFADGRPNDVRLPSRTYWGTSGIYNIHEAWVYDATYTKLREVKLGFNLPQGLIERLPVSTAQVNLVARNLALWTDVPHIDPEVTRDNSNAQGIEYSQYPSPRSVGITVSVTH